MDIFLNRLDSWTGRVRGWLFFFGRAARAWGAMTIVAGLVTFALDLALALALQRFLVSIGLIAASTAAPFFAPIQNPLLEALIFLAIGTMRCGATWLNSVATSLCSINFEAEKRRDILLWAMHSGRAGLGEVTTLFNDLVVGASAAVNNLVFLASRTLLTLGILIVLANYSLSLTAMLLLVVVLATPLQRTIDRRLAGDSPVIQMALADVMDRMVAAVKNSVFLQIHGMVGSESRRGAALVDRYAQASRRYQIDSASRSTIPQLLGLFVVAGIAVQGSTMLGDDKSRVVVYLYLALRLFQNLGDLARYSNHLRLNWPRLTLLQRWWSDQMVPARRLINVGRADAHRFSAPVGWRVVDVSFSWEPETPVLRHQSFEIAPKTITAMIGPSGAGKSTLLLLLAGLLKPQEGAIDLLIDGKEVDLAAGRDMLLASSAYVGPDPFVVPGTIRDFLEFGRTEPLNESEVMMTLRRAHCEFVEALPRALDHPLTEQGGGLSAGQKQRLALARALLRRPRVLFLDEATANLDTETERVIVRTLAELKNELTIVAVTHRQALLEIADAVIEIRPISSNNKAASARDALAPMSV